MPLKSYVDYSPDSDFPLENLPYGIFSTKSDETPRIGVAIGNQILDLKNTPDIFKGSLLMEKSNVFQKKTLNKFMALGRNYWIEARESLQSFLSLENKANKSKAVLVPQERATMHMPCKVGDYTDFYSSYYHAQNCSQLFSFPLLKTNWRHMPLAYHGRCSSLSVSGTDVRRPAGQTVESIDMDKPKPSLQISNRLDFELEVGVFLGGELNEKGEHIRMEEVEDYIFGMVLLNDWSARDIQAWEMAPLGPFNGKNFLTSISPWIVTMEALKPFKCPNFVQKPEPQAYLFHPDEYNFNINLYAHIKTSDNVSTMVTETNYKYLYWTAKQHVVQHCVNGCQLKPGDLLGTGTISGDAKNANGCLLEVTNNGQDPVKLENGQVRAFLEDSDEVILTGHCKGEGYRIGFGECTGKVIESYYILPESNK